ncbi:MAG: radical SAM protein, partial [Firmicutes bacterium]|nr:radical SAM protein [Bacillota bacterium]
SIMNQYTPMSSSAGTAAPQRKVRRSEYERVLDFALSLGIENAFFQEGDTADESFIPPFEI